MKVLETFCSSQTTSIRAVVDGHTAPQRYWRAACLTSITVLAIACRPAPAITLEQAQVIATANAADPTVAIDARTGTSYVAWGQMSADSTWNIFVSSRASSGAFGEAHRVNQIAGEAATSNQFPPQIRVSDDGTVHVGWVAVQNAPGSTTDKVAVIRIAHSTDGGVHFDSAATLGIEGQGAHPSLYFNMATGPKGAVYAAWLDLSRYAALEAAQEKSKSKEPMPPVEADLRFAHSSDNGRTFSATPSLDTISCMCCRASVVATPEGGAYVLWRHVFPGSERDVVVAAVSREGTLSPATRVHDDHWKLDGCPDLGPDIGVAADGSLHVVWFTGAPKQEGLHYATSSDGGKSFGAPLSIRTGGDVPPSMAKVALAKSVPWIVWEHRTATTHTLRLGRITSKDSLETVVADFGSGLSPAIAANAGKLGVVWSDSGKVYAWFGVLSAAGGAQ